MLLRRSRFVHQLPVGPDRILIVHAISHMRLPADKDVGLLLDYFSKPQRVPEDCAELVNLIPYTADAIERAIAGLVDRNILTDLSPDEELEKVSIELAPTHGRDPGELLERYRRELKEGSSPYWAVQSATSLKDLGTEARRVDALLLGDCDIQMESDFLKREAAKRGIDLHVAATFPDDIRFAEEHKHDVIFIGALRTRHTIVETPEPGQSPHGAYIAQACRLLTQLRDKSAAPILIDNLPEPTVQPLGMAEQGLGGHRTRFRLANVTLSELATTIPNVHVVDIAATLAATGTVALLDDGLVGFTHFGSPGWMLQRPEREKKAVHGLFPDTARLAQSVQGNPYGREEVLAAKHIDALVSLLGIERKKCVILDLDGTLWPGVLAETGSPFAWTPEISGAFSYIGLYFGLHEALLCLKKRGIVLACVSKNDEATVRELWKYPETYPRERLLMPDDFVTWRVNWNDKVDNIKSIADELGFALDSFIFIDDHPVERDRVQQRLPDIDVWGDDPFSLRRRLLTDPRLQLSSITDEASQRTSLVKAQLQRQILRSEGMNEATYIASLEIKTNVEILSPQSPQRQRVIELFERTTQFNTTGRKFDLNDLSKASVFILDVSDKFGHHGLVGAAVIANNEILGLAMSCRVLGMGIEHEFMRQILDETKKTCSLLKGRILETNRNIPVRNIYRDHQFVEIEPGLWSLSF